METYVLTFVCLLSMCLGSMSQEMEGCSNTMFGQSCRVPPRDCTDLWDAGYRKSGVYKVSLISMGFSFPVYCDLETQGGWTVFQRRMPNGTTDFDRDWDTYEEGFGDFQSEFWLGNFKLHLITALRNYELRIEMEALDEKVYVTYSNFKVGKPAMKYNVTVTGFDGSKYPDVGDSMEQHNGQKFSTRDQDNDIHVTNCARTYTGGWWFASCHKANLNGLNLVGETNEKARGIVWLSYKGFSYSLTGTEMKIRRIDQV